MTANKKWLESRRKGIGGSDVAAILGLSPWKSAYQVWEDKIGQGQNVDETPAMSYGKLVEPTLRQWYSNETQNEVILPNEVLVHPKHKFMVASVDGLVPVKERVVEIKTSGSSDGWGEPGTDQIPDYYSTQCHHYLAVLGWEVCDVVVSIRGTMPVIYVLERDKEIEEMLIEQEAIFWDLVQTKTPPEPVTFSDMVARFRKSFQASVTATDEILAEVGSLKLIKAHMKMLEADEEYAKATIMKYMAENEALVDADGKPLVTWKTAKPTMRLNVNRLKLEAPEIYKAFLEEGEPSRRFLVKG